MTSFRKHEQRPLSPHLTIYKPQISSVLSITHRLTGIALYAGAFLLALWVIFSVYGCTECFKGILGHSISKVLLFGWNLALFYHLLNGVRHMVWDTGRGFSLPAMRFSGWLVVTLAVVLTVAVWLCVY